MYKAPEAARSQADMAMQNNAGQVRRSRLKPGEDFSNSLLKQGELWYTTSPIMATSMTHLPEVGARRAVPNRGSVPQSRCAALGTLAQPLGDRKLVLLHQAKLPDDVDAPFEFLAL